MKEEKERDSEKSGQRGYSGIRKRRKKSNSGARGTERGYVGERR